ncbi:DUF2975 domain-containing protein [Candidatus Falkowbacteria bacterium]|nr:DUF2975 domain-containing protein [Candidatus Falkowbacteria bacterium]
MTPKEEAEILRLIRVLFCQFEKAEKTKKFPLFSPLKTWVSASGKVQFEIAGATEDAALSLKSIGVTIYHLLAGESEVTKESYRVDGYHRRPIRSKYWTLIEYMLSGRATNASIVRKQLSWGREAADWWKNLRQSSRQFYFKTLSPSRQRQIKDDDLAVSSVGALRPFSTTHQRWSPDVNSDNVRRHLIKTGGYISDFIKWAIFLSSIFLLIFSGFLFIYFIETFVSTGLNISLSLFIFCLIVVGVLIPVRDELNFKKALACLLGVIIISVALWQLAEKSFFWLPIQKDKNGEAISLIIVDRATERFVARLTKNSDDSLARFTEDKIDLVKYRVECGLPLKGRTSTMCRLAISGKELILPLDIEYRLDVFNYDEYAQALRAWETQKHLEEEIAKYFDGLTRNVNRYWQSLQTENSATADDVEQAMQQMKVLAFLRQEIQRQGLSCGEQVTNQWVCRNQSGAEVCEETVLAPEKIEMIKNVCERPEKRILPFVQLTVR